MKNSPIILIILSIVLTSCGGGQQISTEFKQQINIKKPKPTLKIEKRSSWATQEVDLNNCSPMGGLPNKITIHHTSEEQLLLKVSDKEFLRAIERFHKNDRKWAAIGYHYLIGRDGSIYEGRPINLQGTHASGANEQNIGISLLGNFEDNAPTNAQTLSLTDLTQALRSKYHISKKSIFGHRDLCNTECPGDILYQLIQNLKK